MPPISDWTQERPDRLYVHRQRKVRWKQSNLLSLWRLLFFFFFAPHSVKISASWCAFTDSPFLAVVGDRETPPTAGEVMGHSRQMKVKQMEWALEKDWGRKQLLPIYGYGKPLTEITAIGRFAWKYIQTTDLFQLISVTNFRYYCLDFIPTVTFKVIFIS